MDEYLALNRAMWDERAPAHAASPDYAVERLVADPTLLSDVVLFDRPRLIAIRGSRSPFVFIGQQVEVAAMKKTVTGLQLALLGDRTSYAGLSKA